MSKIFEALQYAQTERVRREKSAQQLPSKHQENMQTLTPTLNPQFTTDTAARTACNCDQHALRIRRQGIWDSLLGVFGFYPWQCSQCHRRFHRSARY